MIALVPTCNRPELFARLVSKLEGFEVFGFINNSTPQNEAKYGFLNLPFNVILNFTDIHGDPKECHVRTFKKMIEFAPSECLIIEDDVNPCEHFYDKMVSRIEVLKNRGSEFVLSPIHLPHRNSDFYTGGLSTSVELGNYQFIDSAWVDGNFYMTEGVLFAMKKWLKEPITIYRASSGIGRKNSCEIYKRGWKMYTVAPTLVEHLDQTSVMFGDRRKAIPLISKFED